MTNPPIEVVVTRDSSAAHTLGTISIVIGAFALLFGWIPFLGLFAIPIAIVGLLLAGIGFLVSLIKGFKGVGMPFLGGVLCIVAVVVPLASTGGTSAVIVESMEQESQERDIQEGLADSAAELYIESSLELYDVSAKYRENRFTGTLPGIDFKLRNNGKRSLDKVEVTVYFKNAEGQIITEESYSPVSVPKYISSSSAKPLKPGYVWQMEKDKYFKAKSVPSEWEEGSIDIEITEIRFSEVK